MAGCIVYVDLEGYVLVISAFVRVNQLLPNQLVKAPLTPGRVQAR